MKVMLIAKLLQHLCIREPNTWILEHLLISQLFAIILKHNLVKKSSRNLRDN